MKDIKKNVNRILNRLNFKIKYFIANNIMKNKVDKENDSFKIMSDIDLVDQIVNEYKSLSRFGDGEFRLILDEKFDLPFQYNSPELRLRLTEVLQSNLDNLILGINRSLNNSDIYNINVQKYFRTFNYLYRNKLKKFIPMDKMYANSSITRFYIDFDNSDINQAYARIDNLKRIWSGRDLLIVEGIHTRLGVGNDLFSNSNNIRRILIPETNAFDRYEEILNMILKNVLDTELILLAAGPTATILVYDLALHNIQAVDVGHIDIEYEWMKLKTKTRVAIKGKYVNEIKGKKYVEDSSIDLTYNNSIICMIDNNRR